MKRVTHYLLSPRNNWGRKEGVCLCSHNSSEIFAFRHFAILRRVRISAWELCNFKKIAKGAERRLRRFAPIAQVTTEPNLHAHVGNSGTPPPSSPGRIYIKGQQGGFGVVTRRISYTIPHSHEKSMESQSPVLGWMWGHSGEDGRCRKATLCQRSRWVCQQHPWGTGSLGQPAGEGGLSQWCRTGFSSCACWPVPRDGAPAPRMGPPGNHDRSLASLGFAFPAWLPLPHPCPILTRPPPPALLFLLHHPSCLPFLFPYCQQSHSDSLTLMSHFLLFQSTFFLHECFLNWGAHTLGAEFTEPHDKHSPPCLH